MCLQSLFLNISWLFALWLHLLPPKCKCNFNISVYFWTFSSSALWSRLLNLSSVSQGYHITCTPLQISSIMRNINYNQDSCLYLPSVCFVQSLPCLYMQWMKVSSFITSISHLKIFCIKRIYIYFYNKIFPNFLY